MYDNCHAWNFFVRPKWGFITFRGKFVIIATWEVMAKTIEKGL